MLLWTLAADQCFRPKFEPVRAQLLHAPLLTPLPRPLPPFLLKRRLRASSTGAGTALAAPRFAPPQAPAPRPSDSSRPPPRSKKNVIYYHYGILGHIERECQKKQCGFLRVSVPGAPSPSGGPPPLLPMPSVPQQFSTHLVQFVQSYSPLASSIAQLTPTNQQILAMFQHL